MNWKFTVVLHFVRRKMGLSVLEYCVYDYIYKSQTHTDYGVGGWCDASHRKIGSFFGISEGTVFAIIARGVEWGLCDIDPAHPNQKRMLEKWYNVAYLEENDAEGADIEPVQKTNVQKMNASVRKMNTNRSENERFRSENERFRSENERYKEISNSEGNEKEIPNVRIIDEAVAILEFFNAVTGRKVLTSPKGRGSENVGYVAGLLKKGYTRDEIETMVVFKSWEWKDSERMAKHLDPVTIFKHHGVEYIARAIEARDNPTFLAVLKKSRDAERKQSSGGPIQGSAITQGVADRLKNW